MRQAREQVGEQDVEVDKIRVLGDDGGVYALFAIDQTAIRCQASISTKQDVPQKQSIYL